MYTQVASKLAVTTATPAYSQAVAMRGGNALEVEATAFVVSTTLTITVQRGNDLQNWDDINGGSPDITFTTNPGYDHVKLENIASQYVRLKYAVTGGTGIVAAGINVANL